MENGSPLPAEQALETTPQTDVIVEGVLPVGEAEVDAIEVTSPGMSAMQEAMAASRRMRENSRTHRAALRSGPARPPEMNDSQRLAGLAVIRMNKG